MEDALDEEEQYSRWNRLVIYDGPENVCENTDEGVMSITKNQLNIHYKALKDKLQLARLRMDGSTCSQTLISGMWWTNCLMQTSCASFKTWMCLSCRLMI